MHQAVTREVPELAQRLVAGVEQPQLHQLIRFNIVDDLDPSVLERGPVPTGEAVLGVVDVDLGALMLMAVTADLAAEHRGPFTALTGRSFVPASSTHQGLARYVSTLKVRYALHELIFAGAVPGYCADPAAAGGTVALVGLPGR